MNQILITEKIYLTPEVKRKKKMYKLEFFISIFLIVSFCSYYIYAEYDKYKSEEVSQEILSDMYSVNSEDTTKINENDNVLIVALDYTRSGNSIKQNEKQTASQEEVESLLKETTTNTNTSSNTQTSASNNSESQIHTTKSGYAYTTIGSIEISKINVSYPILSGPTEATDELLKISPIKFWGVNPNEIGNTCIAGHNYRNKKFFSKVPTLETGDIIKITDLTGRTIEYSVYAKYIVDPKDDSCTSQLTGGKREVTLVTCTNDSTGRYIIKAREKN